MSSFVRSGFMCVFFIWGVVLVFLCCFSFEGVDGIGVFYFGAIVMILCIVVGVFSLFLNFDYLPFVCVICFSSLFLCDSWFKFYFLYESAIFPLFLLVV